jgi:hypothetical protein
LLICLGTFFSCLIPGVSYFTSCYQFHFIFQPISLVIRKNKLSVTVNPILPLSLLLLALWPWLPLSPQCFCSAYLSRGCGRIAAGGGSPWHQCLLTAEFSLLVWLYGTLGLISCPWEGVRSSLASEGSWQQEDRECTVWICTLFCGKGGVWCLNSLLQIVNWQVKIRLCFP